MEKAGSHAAGIITLMPRNCDRMKKGVGYRSAPLAPPRPASLCMSTVAGMAMPAMRPHARMPAGCCDSAYRNCVIMQTNGPPSNGSY
eukprot:4490070-Prymnesium_polylepis.1